jgi:glycosyltransferase involved in cell wall biosynthesis
MVSRQATTPGGLEGYLAELSPLLREAGHRVHLLSDRSGPAGVFDAVHPLPQLWADELRFRPDVRRRLEAVLAESGAEVVHLHGLENGGAIRFLASRLPCVRHVHDHEVTCPNGLRLLRRPDEPCLHPMSALCLVRGHLRRCMHRRPLRAWRALARARDSLRGSGGVARWVTVSEYMAGVLALNGVGDPITVLNPLVRVPGEEWTPPANPRGLLFVGRLFWTKGAGLLVDLLPRLGEDVTLDIVGEGPEREAIQASVLRAGLGRRVTLHGRLTGEALRARYRANALLVVPSLWSEPFGTVGLEAAASGRPAVAFRAGGIGEWLVHGVTGLAVQPGSPAALADALREVLADGDRLRWMGQEARRRAEAFLDGRRHARRLAGVLREAADSFRERRRAPRGVAGQTV